MKSKEEKFERVVEGQSNWAFVASLFFLALFAIINATMLEGYFIGLIHGMALYFVADAWLNKEPRRVYYRRTK